MIFFLHCPSKNIFGIFGINKYPQSLRLNWQFSSREAFPTIFECIDFERPNHEESLIKIFDSIER